jgi:hypothetical protein
MQFLPTEHYDYDELEWCTCELCERQRALGVSYRALTDGYHGQSGKETKIAFMAASNKRDIYCELSFRMRDEPDALPFMRWVFTELTHSEKSNGWWAIRAANYLPINYIKRYRALPQNERFPNTGHDLIAHLK